MQQKRGTSAEWALATNFKPLEGELIIYTDINKFKIGDGNNFVNDLPFANATPTATDENNDGNIVLS